jgi:hypothetical protein
MLIGSTILQFGLHLLVADRRFWRIQFQPADSKADLLRFQFVAPGDKIICR